MKKVLFVINTLGGAGAEKALLELLKRFPENEYEVSLYVLLAQGELIHQVPEQVKILNQSYSDASVLSKKGKHILNQQIFKRLFVRGAIFKNLGYMLKNMAEMLKKGKLYPDKLLWRVMADSTQVIDGHYDIQEAQILGCTLLVSDCSGNREQVIDGVDGKMCQLTPEGISAGIEELLSDEEKCREYGKKASEKLTVEKEDVLQMFRFNDN